MSKCQKNENKLTACDALSRALQHGTPTKKSKGLFLPMRINVLTGKPGTDIVQLHSGEFVGTGVMLNFCPFCGQDIDIVGD
ncbi:hypothetical protein [Xenorhabdus cabanillasii]|uniref:Uncharacterized protein n=1 Tax=Xenorhabdus cabanillasii JM26 TaxID=1427517 RepID=W1J8P6_9GAMM|nr:hypothetical protein [Xenorhabdus cabanillasii]PHM75270.1 hypothetical protein Xcab_04262 [Xenorhabdus cabanillasii JM26]CDL86383.1 conserved hypothetical protein [Xenorhabdus cabanillasii JM26]